MASVNKVIIVGNLGRDPEVRYSADGAAMCSVSVATTSSWSDKNSGDRREETEWHRVVFYGRLAEIAGEYLKKGRSIYVEGRLRTRKWTDKENIERYTTEVVAEQMQMLGGRESGEPTASTVDEPPQPEASAAKPASRTARKPKADKPQSDTDGIPF